MFVNENALDWSAIRTHSKDGVVGDVFVSPVDDDVFVSPVNDIIETNDIVSCIFFSYFFFPKFYLLRVCTKYKVRYVVGVGGLERSGLLASIRGMQGHQFRYVSVFDYFI